MGDNQDDTSGLLSNIWGAISSIPDKIQELVTSIGNFFSSFWQSLTNLVNSILTGIGEFFSNLGEGIANGFTSVVNWFGDLFEGLGEWFGNVISGIGDVFSWLGSFFETLLEFVYHIFIPTDEQWSELSSDYSQMGETLQSHIPFVGLFSEELKKAQASVEKTDPLIIRIPSFNYSGGVIGVNTGTKEINLTQIYEPYRAYIRGFLLLVVVALAFVYIIKYVLNYGAVSAGQNIDTGSGKGGGTE